MIRSGMDEVKASITRHIRENFNIANVNGLTSVPAITQNPTRQTQVPRIYIYANGQIEIDSTKEDVPIEYTVNVEVLVRYNSYRGGNRQAQQMLDEIIGSVRGLTSSDYPTVNGYSIYRIQFGEVQSLDFKEEGQTYFKLVCPFHISATQDAVPSQLLPVQSPTFTYSNWTHTPTQNRVERYDSGTIIPTTTYPSGNNGWNFTDASFSIASGATGTLTSGNYNVPSGGEPIALFSSLRYSLGSDSTTVTTLTETTSWNVIDSIRYGTITPVVNGVIPTFTDDTAANYGLRNLANWNIEYGTISPHNETIEITGSTNQYIYIIVDSGVTLTQIRNNLGQNAVGLFNVQTVGDYKIYVQEQPIVFNDFSTEFTLIT